DEFAEEVGGKRIRGGHVDPMFLEIDETDEYQILEEKALGVAEAGRAPIGRDLMNASAPALVPARSRGPGIAENHAALRKAPIRIQEKRSFPVGDQGRGGIGAEG